MELTCGKHCGIGIPKKQGRYRIFISERYHPHVDLLMSSFSYFRFPVTLKNIRGWATWYAEHDQESTLCFYATPFLENMIGPGIGQSSYGGAMFLFPPRMIPDIWEDPRFQFAQSLEERLLAGACAHSKETHVAVVSPIPPKGSWRQIARRYNRKIIPIPLKRFSGQNDSSTSTFSCAEWA